MQISIDQPTVIFLFGRSACEQFPFLLDYWRRAIGGRDWQNVFFVRVAPPVEGISDLQDPGGDFQDFFNSVRDRCVNYTCGADGEFHCSSGMLTTIQKMLQSGRQLYLQMVVSDLGDGAVNPEAIVQAARDVRDYLGIGGLNCIYYLLVNSSFSGREAQRKLAKLATESDENRAYLYLLSAKAQNGGVVEEYEIWRALAYEMLLCSRRSYEKNRLYSLGYTSLNANGSELMRLRRSQLKEIVLGMCRAPMSKKEAWRVLFSCVPKVYQGDFQALDVFEKTNILFVFRKWLGGECGRALFSLTEQQKANFRILSDFRHDPTPGAIREATEKLYEYNYSPAQRDEMLRMVTGVMKNGFLRLIKLPNAGQFPMALMHQIEEALDELLREQIRETQTPFPEMPGLLRPLKMDGYIAQCCDLAEQDTRRRYVAMLAKVAAEALKRQCAWLREILSRMVRPDALNTYARGLDREMEHHTLEDLQSKYNKYVENMKKTLSLSANSTLFSFKWAEGYAPFYATDGTLKSEQLSRMISDGEKLLRSRMDYRFSGTFIDVLSQEIDTTQEMEQFLHSYMNEEKRMLFYIHDSADAVDTRYFVDEELKSPAWMNAHENESYLVDNDNIEKLCWYPLQKTAEEYLRDESKANEIFGTYPGQEAARRFPREESADSEMKFARAEKKGEGEKKAPGSLKKAPPQQADANPREISLYEQNGRFFLTWLWEEGLEGVVVQIGGGRPISCDATQYNISNGLEVTDMIQPGKNHVILFRRDTSRYGEGDVCGRRKTVRYAFLARGRCFELKVKGFPPGNAQMAVREETGKKRVYYPVRNHQAREDVLFKGLGLAGGSRVLETAPGEKFPLVRTRAEANL